LKWFDENLALIQPFLRKHVVVEKDNQRLGPRAVIDKSMEGTGEFG
jgi:hypothetical protein